jgi:hypothetical protein
VIGLPARRPFASRASAGHILHRRSTRVAPGLMSVGHLMDGRVFRQTPGDDAPVFATCAIAT